MKSDATILTFLFFLLFIFFLFVILPIIYWLILKKQNLGTSSQFWSAASFRIMLKGVFAKNERGYRLNAINKRFWSLLILLLSVASIRRKLLKTTHTEEQSRIRNFYYLLAEVPGVTVEFFTIEFWTKSKF